MPTIASKKVEEPRQKESMNPKKISNILHNFLEKV